MNNLRSVCLIGCFAFLSLQRLDAATVRDTAAAKEAELTTLRQELDLSRDSLQNEIADRWRAKQRAVEQRESDKEELERLKESLEKTYAEIGSLKEECFSKERAAEEEMSAFEAKQGEWRSLSTALQEVFAREAKAIDETFPLDRETRRSDLESLRRSFQQRMDPAAGLDAFVEYAVHYLDLGAALTIVKQTVLADDGKPRLLTVARFGSVFGYGLSENGEMFIIRQSGRQGKGNYTVEKITAPALQTSLRALFPTWVASGSVTGMVPTDVLQNDQTSMLIEGKKIGRFRTFYHSVKAGGAVMVPLLLLPLWALVLVIFKLVQFGGRRRLYCRHYGEIVALLDADKPVQALDHAKKQNSAIGRIAKRCLIRTAADRPGLEKAVREIMVEEIPQFGRYLNTLAVIAGAAPLLGLLGTISGMINLFGAVTHYGTGDPKFLAGGISEALITAKTGLAIAIPVLFIHDYLRNTKERLQADLEKYALRLLNRLHPGG
jgi:biopolymer transport protein ExbB